MKILQTIAWISVILGVILIIMACLCMVHINPVHVKQTSHYFIASNSFLLLSIALFIYSKIKCDSCCDSKEDKPKV